MPALTVDELNLLRGSKHRGKLYLSVGKPRSLLTGSVNNGSIGAGETAIVYDNGGGSGFSQVKAGQTLRVSTSFGVYFVRIRSISGNQTAGTVTVAANDVPWEDDQGIEVLEDYRLWPLIPKFDGGGVFYKDQDIAYTDQNSEPDPVCIAGPHRAVFLPPVTALSLQVGQSSDDGYERSDNVVIINSSTLEANDAGSWLAFRLQGVTIPQGATILSAISTVTTSSTSHDDPAFDIYAEDHDDAPTLTATNSNISSRSRTTASVNWTATGIGTGAKDGPDLAAVVQEVIDRPGWVSGNDLMLIWDALTGCDFWVRGYDFNPLTALSLAVQYTSGAVIEVDLSDSYATADGATIASYGLAVVPSAGVTISFNTGTGVGTAMVAQPGQYWFECSCTDSNGKTSTTRRRVWVHSPTVGDSDYPFTNAQVTSLHGDLDRGGWNLSMTVRGTIDTEEFPEEALICLWYESWYGATSQYIGGPEQAKQVLFAGYIQRGSVTANEADQSVSFEAATIEALLKEITMYSISLAASRSPVKWYEYALWLTPGRAIHHILLWHSTFFSIADFYGLTQWTLRRKYAELQQNNLWSMVTEMARSMSSVLCSNRAGQMYMAYDVQLLNDTQRLSIATVAGLEDSDYSELAIAEAAAKVGQITVSGLFFDGSAVEAFCSKAPGEVPSPRGASYQNIDRLVVEDQDHANDLSGRHLARANNPYPEVRLPMNGLWLALDVIPQEFWTITVPPEQSADRLDWVGKKLLPRSISIRIVPEAGYLSIEAIFETEAEGPVGTTIQCLAEMPDAPEHGPPKWDVGDDGSDGSIVIGGSLSALIAWVDDGSGVYYRDSNDTDWTQKDTQACHHGELDPWWRTLYRNNTWNPEGAVLWEAGTGFLFRSDDGGDTWQDVTPLTDPPNSWSDSPAPTVADLEFSCVRANMFSVDYFYALARWQNGSGDWRGWLAWTGDNGLSWSWWNIHTTNESYPIFLSVSLGASAHLWMTYLRGGNLYLRRANPLSPGTTAAEVSLGAATITEVLARDKWAVPVSAYADDALVFVIGRMDAPGGLTGIQHVIMSDDTASSFSSIIDDWDTDHGSAMMVSADPGAGRTYYALRRAIGGTGFLTWQKGVSSVLVEDNDSFGGVSVKLDEDRVAILFQDGIDGEIAGKVANISTGAIVLGSSNQLAAIDQAVAAARLEDDKFIIGYRDTGNSDRPTLAVVSASGNTLTEGTAAQVDTIAADSGRIIVISSGATAGLICYATVVGINTEGWMNKFTVSGTSVSPGTPVEHSESASGVYFIAGVGLTGNTVLIVYRGSGDDLRAQIIEFSVGVTEGTAVQVENGSGSIFFDTSTEQALGKLEDGKAVVVYTVDSSGTITIKARVIEYSGTTITTVGTATTVSTAGSTGTASVAVISPTRILVAYKNSSGINRAETFTISGTTITSDSNAGTAGQSAPTAPYVTILNEEYAIVSWQNSSQDIYADYIQNTSPAVTKLYQGVESLAYKSDVPVADVEPGALAVNLAGEVFVGSGSPSAKMVVKAEPPYSSWGDLTGIIPTTGAKVTAIRWLPMEHKN